MMTSLDDKETPIAAAPSEDPQPKETEPPMSTSTEQEQEQEPPSSCEDDNGSDNNGGGGDGVWGLASAFGGSSGWGLGGGGGSGDSPDAGGNPTGATDAELKELESSIAAAETAVSSAIWSTFGAVTSVVSGVVGGDADATTGSKNAKDPNAPLSDADLDAFLEGESSKNEQNNDDDGTRPTEAATPVTPDSSEAQAPEPAASASIWSSLGAVVSESLVGSSAATTASSSSTTTPSCAADEEGGGDDDGDHHPAVASASSALYNLYTSNVNRAAEWIEDLERANADNDPYKRLKEHLNAYLEAHPRGNYEEWVQIYMSQHGWDASDHDHNNQSTETSPAVVVVDPSYYTEDCPHRILWNERNYQDGIQIGDENPQRAYVPTPSTRDDRRHKPPTASSEDEEVITFDGVGETDDGPQTASPSTPPREQQRPLFTDDESLVVVPKPSPVLSCSTLDTKSDEGSGIVVSKVTSTTEVPILEND